MPKVCDCEEECLWEPGVTRCKDIVKAILRADAEPPEAAFDNVDDMLAYLNETPKPS